MTDKTWTNVCPIFVHYLTEVEQKSSLSNLCPDIVPVQSLSNICPIFFWHGFRDILSDFCPMLVHVQYLSMSKVCPTLKTTLVGYPFFMGTKKLGIKMRKCHAMLKCHISSQFGITWTSSPPPPPSACARPRSFSFDRTSLSLSCESPKKLSHARA